MIEWCNNNQGFVSAILTIAALLLSGIAIFVSLKTARLPYKKKLKLYSSYKYFMAQTIYGSVHDAGSAICISAVNVGNRVVNLTYLGLGFLKDKKMGKIALLNPQYEPTIDCAETTSVDYTIKNLLGGVADTVKGQVLYAYACDSEGKEYKKKIGTYEDIIDHLKP